MPQKSSQNLPPQTEEQQSSAQQKKIIPISRNSHKREQVKYNKPHCIIPVADMTWVLSQAKSIQNLWHECWTSDQYGSRWIRLTTSLSEKAFRVARQALSKAGLFEFKRETCTDDTRKTAHWLVKNLHGARRIQEFWTKDDDTQSVEETAVEIVPISGIDEPNNGQEILDVGQKMPDISPETLEKSSVSESLSNSSLTPQELLKEVPEAKESITAELLERVRSYAGEKIVEKLKSVLARCARRSNGELTALDYYKDFFATSYNWRIDTERLQQILDLNQHCQQVFLQQFKCIYKSVGLSAPKTFDQAINFVIADTKYITEMISQQAEYFQKVWERREQMFGNTAIQT